MNKIISELMAFLVIIGISIILPLLIVLFVKAYRKKNWKFVVKILATDILIIIIFAIIGSSAYERIDRNKENIVIKENVEQKSNASKNKEESDENYNKSEERKQEKEENETNRQLIEYEKQAESLEAYQEDTKTVDEMTEEEYKEYCEELWYDDIFFSEENLKGHHVRLEIYVEESKFFKLEAIYDETTVNFINKYNLQRELFACGVSRGEPNSYVGGQINLYFSDDYGYKQSDYETGQELIIYGEIVDYSRNTWNGYNVCGVIPRYIEEK